MSAEAAAPVVRRVAPAEARALVEAGHAVLVDTRDRRLYENVHVAGAISLPLAEIAGADEDAKLGALPLDRLVIFYCA